MTAALEGFERSAARPGRTLPRERPGTHCTGGWVAPGPVWKGGRSRPHRDLIPDRPARSSVAIPTELPGKHINVQYLDNVQEQCGQCVSQSKQQIASSSVCTTDSARGEHCV
jgi:hypothetical protein